MGTQNPTYLSESRWQVEIAYQHLDTNDFYVQSERNDSAGPFGLPPQRKVNVFNLNLTYGLNDRMTVQLNVPYLTGSGGFHQGTAASHQLYKWDTEGVGDLTVEAEYWLTDPKKPSRLIGSVAMGIKTPTGSTRETGQNFTPTGDVERNLDETLQLGDGGWGVLLRGQGTAELGGPWLGYGSAFYLVSLNERYDVLQGGAYRGIPDVYSARLGAAYLLSKQNLALMLGGMVNGVTVRDLIDGGDLYWRRPGYEVYAEPGVSWTRGADTFTVSYPLRVYQKKHDSLLDESLHRRIGSDFTANLIKLSYARRF